MGKQMENRCSLMKSMKDRGELEKDEREIQQEFSTKHRKDKGDPKYARSMSLKHRSSMKESNRHFEL